LETEAPVTQLGPMTISFQAPKALPVSGGEFAPKLARVRNGVQPLLADRGAHRGRVASRIADEEARKELEERIALFLPAGRLALAVTDNRHTMISVRREKGLFRLRLHHMFLGADPDVVRAIARYVAHNDSSSSRLLGRYIDGNHRMIRRARRLRSAPVMIEMQGEVHDLKVIYECLNHRYFDGEIEARITWGQRLAEGGKRRRRNSIKMGSYSVEDRLIRIHPSLDRPFVPSMFVEWIVYHEMLHQKHEIPLVRGRRQFHTAAFLAEEARFECYEQARRWEQSNIDRILDY
jgi:hypothetical protein